VAISSMTGFARASAARGTFGWTWEVRSVNGRGLDVRCRMPAGYEVLESEVRTRVDRQLARGNVSVTLRVEGVAGELKVRVNEAVLAQLCRAAQELQARLPAAGLSADGLLAQRGVVEIGEAEEEESTREAREREMLSSFDTALAELAAVRRREGDRLSRVLGDQLAAMEALVETAGAAAAVQPEMLRQRLQTQLAALLAERPEGLPEERVAQEVALLATKADVREELDRLKAHIAAARELIAGETAAGRRLDFLAQEFNREANTLLSKSADLELTRLGLDLKASIDQLREQAQNIE